MSLLQLQSQSDRLVMSLLQLLSQSNRLVMSLLQLVAQSNLFSDVIVTGTSSERKGVIDAALCKILNNKLCIYKTYIYQLR